MSETDASTYRTADLITFGKQIFMKLGMPAVHADIAIESLVRADMEGNESHGISRLPIYAKRMQEGRIAPDPDIKMVRNGSILQVDGGNGLGQVVAYRALQTAIPMAKEYGLVGMFIRSSNHFGTAAFFCQQICKENMALMAMTNSPPGIPPWGGKKAFFGTNPIAFGFPIRQGPPVIIDMSSSIVARGKIILADKLGQEIPEGWAMDENGADTTDPAAALKGAILPLGGVKGYALAMAIEIMCGVLSGAAYGPHVRNLYQDGDPAANVGHSFILLDISRWMTLDHYFDLMEGFIQELKDTPTTSQTDRIYYPGERRDERYRQRSASGVTISDEVTSELTRLGEGLGIVFCERVKQP
ncbi:Ldh family oxidoreductase [Paenibacillus nasutitermitis]|uniref:Lactate dehydrogenase n=1 Tax=Paenibacillus nasutitermitis TaxID=1652958 RepID=A0A916YUX8_9BACL|nr:Ldh family oxidoreductase [Paenibacillus nasutitermitis]GGD61697.1 lactate dehydrogenase [Paenibacillus nasutitermitis]